MIVIKGFGGVHYNVCYLHKLVVNGFSGSCYVS